MAKAKKKTKAQLEYERVRRNVLQQRRRAEKAGLPLWIDLPAPLARQKKKGQKITADEWKKATQEIKRAGDWLKKAKDRWKEHPETEIPDASKQIIDNFLNNVSIPSGREITVTNGSGGQIIAAKVTQMVAQYGPEKVADVIMEMTSQGDIITRVQIYDNDSAMMYISRMGYIMMEKGYTTEKRWQKFEDQMARQYGESVEEELQ